jgi:hypothetical protein
MGNNNPKNLPCRTANEIELIEYLMGYVEDDSDTPIILSQDDASNMFIVTTHHRGVTQQHYGLTLHAALYFATFCEKINLST